MSRTTVFSPGEFYHLYNRGTEKRTIFTKRTDYERFLALLFVSNGTNPIRLDDFLKYQGIKKKSQGSTLRFLLETYERGDSLVDIAVYCLMPNHFHLLVRERVAGGVSKFMQKLSTAYTMYFNTLHERTGSLFQGKFKATHATDDQYLAYLISYIHLNPVKLIEPRWKETGIANRERAYNYLEKYPYSSFLDYTGETRLQEAIIHKSVIPPYCESVTQYKQAVKEWLAYRDHTL